MRGYIVYRQITSDCVYFFVLPYICMFDIIPFYRNSHICVMYIQHISILLTPFSFSFALIYFYILMQKSINMSSQKVNFFMYLYALCVFSCFVCTLPLLVRVYFPCLY
jgi:hypothetical protein